MGYEFKIKAVLSEADREAITVIFELHPHFSGKINSGGKVQYEFKNKELNHGSWPDAVFMIETDGLYCCGYNNSKPWESFDVLLAYLEGNEISFQIEEI